MFSLKFVFDFATTKLYFQQFVDISCQNSQLDIQELIKLSTDSVVQLFDVGVDYLVSLTELSL